jgi:hypothetical protein
MLAGLVGMANAINRLTARKVQSLDVLGRHADGGGLYLNVTASGAKSWIMLYRMGGKRHEMGLGAIIAVPLVEARELAAEARQKIAVGINPLHEKRASPSPVPTKAATFAEVAITYMADRETTWRNAAHRAQWRQTLEVQAEAAVEAVHTGPHLRPWSHRSGTFDRRSRLARYTLWREPTLATSPCRRTRTKSRFHLTAPWAYALAHAA